MYEEDLQIIQWVLSKVSGEIDLGNTENHKLKYAYASMYNFLQCVNESYYCQEHAASLNSIAKKEKICEDAKKSMNFICVYEGLRAQYEFKKEQGLTGDDLAINRVQSKSKDKEVQISKLEMLQLINRGIENAETFDHDSDREDIYDDEVEEFDAQGRPVARPREE